MTKAQKVMWDMADTALVAMGFEKNWNGWEWAQLIPTRENGWSRRICLSCWNTDEFMTRVVVNNVVPKDPMYDGSMVFYYEFTTLREAVAFVGRMVRNIEDAPYDVLDGIGQNK